MLDEINLEKGSLSIKDKNFFKNIFDRVNQQTPKGRDYVQPKTTFVPNNFENQFP